THAGRTFIRGSCGSRGLVVTPGDATGTKSEKGGGQMTGRYWEAETPEETQTEKVFLAYFPKAGKLQISRAFRGEDGELRRGKTAVLDAEDLALHPEARELVRRFLDEAQA